MKKINTADQEKMGMGITFQNILALHDERSIFKKYGDYGQLNWIIKKRAGNWISSGFFTVKKYVKYNH